jgi:5-methyltetrahydropteroyltriglutamate--homocysteine methyltransferase
LLRPRSVSGVKGSSRRAPRARHHAISHVEHPEPMAQRIRRCADLVGEENVIVSTDCGIAQASRIQRQHPSLMLAKLEALAEGAHIASRRCAAV